MKNRESVKGRRCNEIGNERDGKGVREVEIGEKKRKEEKGRKGGRKDEGGRKGRGRRKMKQQREKESGRMKWGEGEEMVREGTR